MTRRFHGVVRWHDDAFHHEIVHAGPETQAPSAHDVQDYLYECYGHLHLEGLSTFYAVEQSAPSL